MLKKKRIFVDSHVFDGEFQGTWTYLKEIYSILIKERPNDIFYFGAYNIGNLKEIFKEQNNVKYIKYRFKNRLIRLGLEIPLLLYRNKINIAHFQYITPFFKVCKYLITIHDVLFNDYKSEFSKFFIFQKNLLYKRSAKFSDYILTVSNYSKNRIENYYPFTKNKIKVTPNAVNTKVFFLSDKITSQEKIKSTYGISKYILYVSRIEPRKKHDLLLKAFINLKLDKKGYSLVFIGKETIKNINLNKLLIANPNLSNYFCFESIEQNDLRDFYNGSELFVYPSIAEGFGIPPLEAGVLKTPVLCSSETAMGDFQFFEDDHFEPENVIEFQDKLLAKLTNKTSDEKLNYICKSIQKKYNWEESAKCINTILNTI